MGLADTDIRFMEHALGLARRAGQAGEVPVGAIVVRDGEIAGEGYNCPIRANDPTAHAEIQALRAAGRKLGDYRLLGTTLYVTLEPCPMCAGAMVHARIARLVFAAPDPKTGAAGSVADLVRSPDLNHTIECTGGVLAEESGRLLREFFGARR